MRKSLVLILVIMLFSAMAAQAAIVTSSGSAGGNLRVADKPAIQSALLGGVRAYMRKHAPHRKNIGKDYLMFVRSFEITSRRLSGGSLVVSVRMDIDEMVADDSSAALVMEANDTVFNITGLPSTLPASNMQKDISDVFGRYEFSTKNQARFERELVDRNRRSDVMVAYDTVKAKYLFNIKLGVQEGTGDGTCVVSSDISYLSSDNVSRVSSLMKTETTANNADANACLQEAVTNAVNTSLAKMRGIAPLEVAKNKAAEYSYQVRFNNVVTMKPVNEVVNNMKNSRMVNTATPADRSANHISFTMVTFMQPANLATRIQELKLPSVSGVQVQEATGDSPAVVIVNLNAAPAPAAE
jgi:GTP:adenosylcobinamide-phosphate guanylyltransferase